MAAHLVPRDFLAAVQDIKLAILQARSRAARASNAEALKLYFFVGGYVSAKTRKAKWGSGAIDALSERLQVELPGLRGFCASARAFWSYEQLLQHLRADDYRHIGALPNNFGKTLSPMALATRAVRSFRDEYVLDLVNLDNVDERGDQDVDERVLSRSLAANVERTIQSLGGSDFCFMGREKRLLVEGSGGETTSPTDKDAKK